MARVDPSRGSHRLRHSADFRRVLRDGKRHVGKLLVVYVSRSSGPTRAGFVVARGVGNAVRRNRARRLMKEAWRKMAEEAHAGTEVVFVARQGLAVRGMVETASDMRSALEALGALGP